MNCFTPLFLIHHERIILTVCTQNSLYSLFNTSISAYIIQVVFVIFFKFIGGIRVDYYAIGQRIRKFRKAKRLSQEELAELVGISTTHMSHIETGNTKLSLNVLVDIAAALNVLADDLLSETGPTQTNSAYQTIYDTLTTCTPQQVKIMSEIITAAKTAMDKYN